MYRLSSAVVVFVVLFSMSFCVCSNVMAGVPLNQLTEVEQRSGWELLFDGKTTRGWRNFRQDSLSDGWVIADGAISRSTDGAGDIITVGEYDNFELSIEYRISEGGNSGIMFRVTEEEEAAWLTGPEVQILDNTRGRDQQKAGWLYQLYHPAKPTWVSKFEKEAGIQAPEIDDATRPAGQWNHVYLRVSAEQCEVAVNGVSYYYFRIGNDDWNKRVAASKFAQLPNFGKSPHGHICLQDHGNPVAFRNIKIRKLPADGTVPDPVDGILPLKGVVAFPHLQWEDWDGIDENGKTEPLRIMILTHAGDDSNRLFAANQRGAIYVFPNDPEAKEARLFLDIRSKVFDWDFQPEFNEEGLLGMAFHPEYATNGQFFVYYSSESEPRTSIVSRFRVSRDDPHRADPESEEVLMKIPQPFSNHNGGAIQFGPDGYLYIALGDGGSRNDPLGHGQNLDTWLGSILRIDVDKTDKGRKYAIPPDNPFRDRSDARPEIYAYGFRNIWRLSFDRVTGTLWAADVGQDLWEELNIVRSGENYGWSTYESKYIFGNLAPKNPDSLVDSVWEYDHQIGKSVTGGFVYRGSQLPELYGKYLYADYVSGKIWALEYNEQSRSVVTNLGIRTTGIPVHSFGEDNAGEVYYMLETVSGQGIYRFERVE